MHSARVTCKMYSDRDEKIGKNIYLQYYLWSEVARDALLKTSGLTDIREPDAGVRKGIPYTTIGESE